ncbi:transglutaminase family protein [Novosphingobium sp. 9]|uniref:transglutaminase family protein n=1 Tax=Novosphingobium sp. 9 TaxID=2025349 RepID=UPI0021B52E0A|nr:transglutaminase family protein [Novosphingobium sp. 9]
MLLSVAHTTRYGFSQGVSHGLQRLRLRPKSTHGQRVIDWSVGYLGAKPEAEYVDQNDNRTVLVSIDPGVEEVVITCRGEVETVDNNGVTGSHSGLMPLWCFLRPTALTRPGPAIRDLVSDTALDRANPLDMLHHLSQAVGERIAYTKGASDAATTAEEALVRGEGVCQDHAHVLIAAGRLLDIPMRYVGGYLRMEGQDEQEAGHGWAEAHVPGLGWVGFDVSNAICPDERYIRVATGCDYAEAAPVTGLAVGAGDTSLSVHLSVGEKMLGSQAQQQSGSDSGQSQSQSASSGQQVQGG